MKKFKAIFTGFTGAQFTCDIYADSRDEASDIAFDHMCQGDIVTIEAY